jgi:hypothetical protein
MRLHRANAYSEGLPDLFVGKSLDQEFENPTLLIGHMLIVSHIAP